MRKLEDSVDEDSETGMTAATGGRRVFLDANVLLLLYIGSFDPALIGQFKRTRQYTVEDFALLREIVGFLPRLSQRLTCWPK